MKAPAVTEEYAQAVLRLADDWIPACGGWEVPFPFQGGRYLYCYNPRRRSHRYLDCQTDLLMPRDWQPVANPHAS